MTVSQVRRIVAATLIALIALSGLTSLGFWQYARAHRDDIARTVYAKQPIAVQRVLAPGSYLLESDFTRAVQVRGNLLWASTVASCDRAQRDGTTGCWLLAPITIDDKQSVTVVLGFVPESQRESALASARARATEAVAITGRMQPDEMVGVVGGAIMQPSDTVAYVDAHTLAMLWRLPLLDGSVVADPALTGSAVTATLITPPSGITWRNLLYAWQWWAFALFVLFLLARYIIDVRNEGRTLVPQMQEEQS